ncbi:chaperone for protein-folding within the ER, fungal-domain-containing protein [Crucibulum laeve]|uniref:Protein ROT1 n=1 Tax=Crucibulum laeve TaxID=68775 RepID=A0A5C3M5B4_9AGAR|nr:chaperone for protein-folding within the ER, fungal-domain-containing protein [Crucibulum laeve]
MIITSLFALALASFAPVAYSQDIVYDSIHNATTLTGTWSSGSRGVMTGAGFANPANMTFTYPKTTGVSFSFTDDGFYEISRYRFNGNGSEPTCITGVIGWVHGKYTLNANGSITMVPLGDGFQQVQDPCAAVSNFIEPYNITETYVQWRIFQDPTQGFKLHLFQFDGAPLAPQFLVSPSPNMLPTTLLRNTSAPTTVAKRSLEKRSGNGAVANGWTMGAAAGMVVAGVASLIL